MAEPSAAVIVADDGLHPIFCGEYEPVNVGPVLSFDHVIVLDAVEVLPQASVAVQVLVTEEIHPTVDTEPVLATGVTLPQLSVAVAFPRLLFC